MCVPKYKIEKGFVIFRVFGCGTRTCSFLSLRYSKSQIFVQKFNIITSFSPNQFLTIFLVKVKLSTAKKPKTTTFSRVFLPKKKSTIFSGNQSWIFGQKLKISNSVAYTMISLVGCRAATLSATLKRLVCPVKSFQVSMLPNGKYPGSYGMPWLAKYRNLGRT